MCQQLICTTKAYQGTQGERHRSGFLIPWIVLVQSSLVQMTVTISITYSSWVVTLGPEMYSFNSTAYIFYLSMCYSIIF